MRFKNFQKIVDIIRGKKSSYLIDTLNVLKIHYQYKETVSKLKKKLLNGEKIKVAFLFMYATDCQNLPIYEKMLNDEVFSPYFIINPDISRSKENFDLNYKHSKEELIKKYGNDRILDGYNYENNSFIDYTDKFDLATTNNPYDAMTHEYFKIEYWAKKNIPIFYCSYFYMGRCHVSIENLKMKQFNYFWKFYAENKYVLKLAKKYEIIKGLNTVVAGYPKMDKLIKIKPQINQKKSIIISPHHTIDDSETSVGDFLNYYDILLQLPKKYPNIDFVFRPHPLLFENLKNKHWNKERCDDYLKELLKNPNVIYSTEGEYMDLFAKSDALIHDCGSFLAEYLYTKKPCAYLYKKTINANKVWTDFGKSCLNSHYLINSESDLYEFIDNVVIGGNDVLKTKRNNFAENVVMTNYPYSTDFIFENIKQTFYI